MSWVKIETGYLRHPKMLGLPHTAQLVHLASILWTAEHLQDGYVPSTAVRQLFDSISAQNAHRRRYEQMLIDRGLWERAIGGIIVHDFAKHNAPSLRANVERERELSAERVRRFRERHERRDESM